MSPFTGPPNPRPIAGGGGGGPITRSCFWPARGEGGDRYNTTTCGMAKDTKDPCISHVDASHAEWPRIESSLLFVTFFYVVKIVENSLSYKLIGFIGKITSKRRIRYFFYFLTLKTFYSNKPLKKARPFSSLDILMRVNLKIHEKICILFLFQWASLGRMPPWLNMPA